LLTPSLRFGPLGPAFSGFPSTPTLSGATQTVTPSCGFAPLQGFLPKISPVISRCRHLLQGFPGRSAYPFQRSPHTPESPTLRVTVPRAGFLALFAGYSSTGLAGLFHPANALRLLPSGISPPKELRRLFACAVLSCRSPSVGLPQPRTRDLWRTVPTVLGVGRMPFTGFTALLPLRVRSV